MSIFSGFHASASGLTAQRLRMDVVSANLANSHTTRATINENGQFEPYRRKMVTLAPTNKSFKTYLNHATNQSKIHSQGVRVTGIKNDDEPFKLVFDPAHPDALQDGYVRMPNVNPLKEMVDLMSATRSYEANITALNASKSMLMKTLEIGK